MLNLLDKDTLLLDNSGLSQANDCPRRFQYAHNHGRVPATGRTALVAGSAIHEALHYINLRPQERATVLPALEPIVRSVYARENWQWDGEEWRTPERCMDLLGAYLEQWPSDEWEVLESEQPFVIPLGTVGVEHEGEHHMFKVLWQGRRDLLIRWHGMVYVLDYKTSTRWDNGYWDQWVLDPGQIGYVFAARRAGHPVEGTIIRGLLWRKPTAKPNPKYPRNEFDQRIFQYSDETLDEWQRNTLVQCHDLLGCYLRNYYPQNRKSCVGKFGRCPYHDVCISPANMREKLLSSSMFRDNDWSPLVTQAA